MLYFFQKYYNSVINIDGMKSRWFMQDMALEQIQKNVEARSVFARDFFDGKSDKRPCIMENLNIVRVMMKQSLSQYGYFCPVSWKADKTFVNCGHLAEYSVLYKQSFYFFAGPKQREIFIRNPSRFTQKVIFSSAKRVPVFLRPSTAAELISNEKELLGHCPVTLQDEEKIEQCNQLLLVKFDNKNYVMANV